MQTIVRDHYIVQIQRATITFRTKRHKLAIKWVKRVKTDYVKALLDHFRGVATATPWMVEEFEHLEGLAFILDHIIDLKGNPEAKRLQLDCNGNDGYCQGTTMESALNAIVTVIE